MVYPEVQGGDSMKSAGILSTAFLLLLLSESAMTFGDARQPLQQGQAGQQQGGPQGQQKQGRQKQDQQHRTQQQQQQQQQQQRQTQQQRQGQTPQQQQQQRQSARRRQLQRSPQQQRAQQMQQRSVWQQRRANRWDAEHRTWQQRGGYNGYRIPGNYFGAYYGPRHWFRIYSLPFMVTGGFPRFQYGGYWFTILDPYPEYWGYDWYENNDVYVDYSYDGYYLYNRMFPGRPGIAVSISF